MAYKMYENNITFSVSENVMHHVEKVKFYLFHWKVAFSTVQTVYVFMIKYLVLVKYLPSQIYFLT